MPPKCMATSPKEPRQIGAPFLAGFFAVLISTRECPNYRTFINGALSGNILIDTSQAGTDTIDYVAADTWGNTSTSTRSIIAEPTSSSPSI